MSKGLTIDVKLDYKSALEKLDANTVEKLATAALVSGALLIANQAKKNAPIKTGSLRRSIHVGGHTELTRDFESGSSEYSDLGAPGELRAIVGTNLEYAAIQEFGGTIVPKHAQALHWVTKAGEDVFAQSVTIPAHPYLTPAMQTERDAVLKEAAAAFEELVAKEVGKL